MWNVIIKGNTDAKLAETDGYQWMTNPSKIATGDAKQILDQKFNHFNNQLIFFGNIQCHGSMASVVQHLHCSRHVSKIQAFFR